MLKQIIALVASVIALNAFAAVDANRASQAELESVKGIGPGLSTRILEARKGSAFKDWSDFVERVPGIGPGNAARFSDHGLTVGGNAWAGQAAAKPEKSERRPARKASAEPRAQ